MPLVYLLFAALLFLFYGFPGVIAGAAVVLGLGLVTAIGITWWQSARQAGQGEAQPLYRRFVRNFRVAITELPLGL